MPETLEITSLRPAPGQNVTDFIAANTDIDAYLRARPGFLWRRITQAQDGTVFDIVAYDSMAHAESGAAGISGEMSASPVHATIDHSSVSWNLTNVLHSVDGPFES